jgi:hypothetical protein
MIHPTVSSTIREETIWTLTSDDIEEAVLLYCNAPKEASVSFDVGQVLRGAIVRNTTTKVD